MHFADPQFLLLSRTGRTAPALTTPHRERGEARASQRRHELALQNQVRHVGRPGRPWWSLGGFVGRPTSRGGQLDG
jgi:hypothetical protein